jgi:hypothetical protein
MEDKKRKGARITIRMVGGGEGAGIDEMAGGGKGRVRVMSRWEAAWGGMEPMS